MAATRKAAPKAKATAKKAAPRKTKAAVKKTAPAPTAEAKVKAAPKKPKAAAKKAAPKMAAVKKAALLRLSDKQKDFLRKILESGDAGYDAIKAEIRSIEGLIEKKLVKKGPRAKGAATTRYLLTKAGQKHSTPGSNEAPPPTA